MFPMPLSAADTPKKTFELIFETHIYFFHCTNQNSKPSTAQNKKVNLESIATIFIWAKNFSDKNYPPLMVLKSRKTQSVNLYLTITRDLTVN
jgi:hypothetical protein